MALKVYGGSGFVDGKQMRMIVAAKSWKRASELTGVSLSYLRNYWSMTGNVTEVEIATSEPEVVFYVPLDEQWTLKKDKKNWKRLEK